MIKNRVHKEDFSKLSTGEFPVFNGLVPALGQAVLQLLLQPFS
jgi:hypothetical protein